MWGNESPMVQDHFMHPFGAGLRLDRAQFDRELWTWAEQSGAVLMAASIGRVERRGQIFMVAAKDGSEHEARVVVDASGRSSFVARRFGAVRLEGRRLFAVSGILAATAELSAYTVVVAVREGWWYAVTLPDGQLLACLHCDIDLARTLSRDPEAWLANLKDAPIIRDRVDLEAVAAPSLTIASAGPEGLNQLRSDGWMAIGDAARSFDPLTAQGLSAAVRDGVDGANAIVAALSGDSARLAAFDGDRIARYAQIERLYRDAYRSEDRFSESPFWRRRQQKEGCYGELRGDRRYA